MMEHTRSDRTTEILMKDILGGQTWCKWQASKSRMDHDALPHNKGAKIRGVMPIV